MLHNPSCPPGGHSLLQVMDMSTHKRNIQSYYKKIEYILEGFERKLIKLLRAKEGFQEVTLDLGLLSEV